MAKNRAGTRSHGKGKSAGKGASNARSTRARKPVLTARTADKHELYQEAVQCPEAELDFVERVFTRLRGRKPVALREDFCGTAFTSCEWVKRRAGNTAVGVDLHKPTLAWGLAHNAKSFTPEQRRRLTLLNRNVLTPGPKARGVDAVLAMNFSYWIFKQRDQLLAYFKGVRESLKADGLFFLDSFGGYETFQVITEKRRCKGFKYVWEQASFNPIDNSAMCKIHFEFKRGPRMEEAFTYSWRVWTTPEICDVLRDAGFRNPTVYWEGDDGKGGGNGVFRAQKVGEDCASFVAYIVAEK